MRPFGINNLTVNRLGIASSVRRSWASYWTNAIYILKSGATWYKRERNPTLGYFKLWYSSDSGANYAELFSLDINEDSVIIDTAHAYTHQIVGTAYQVLNGEDLLFTT